MLEPAIIELDKLVMHGVPKISSSSIKPYVNIINVKSKSNSVSTLDPEKKIAPKKYSSDTCKVPIEIDFVNKLTSLIIGDNLFKVYHLGSFNSTLAFRFALNTSFIKEADGQNG